MTTDEDKPYTYYSYLRQMRSQLVSSGGTMTASYAEVVAILRDERFSAERIIIDPAIREEFGPIFDQVARQMLFLDPPAHTRLRSLVNKAFTPRVVEGMRSHIQEIVDDLLDKVAAKGSFDVIADLAEPLPVTIIAEMLGVPAHDQARFKEWSDHFAAFIGGSSTAETIRETTRSLTELTEYLREILAELSQHPNDSLISALAQVEDAGQRLSEDELASNCLLLLAAGHETTTNLIGNGLLALLEHPRQLEKLRQQPDLITSAVEELLRYDSPVQWTSRVTKQNVDWQGLTIPAGREIGLCLGAANHDPAQFDDPDHLDITRANNRHVAFGHGVHFCLGAALARLEGQLAIGTVIKRWPNLRLTGQPVEWLPSPVFRGLKALPVTF